MFQRIGRRLALLNALVVIVVITIAGVATYIALSRSLEQEVDNALRDRVGVVLRSTDGLAPSIQPATPSDDEDDHDEDDDEDDDHDRDLEVLESGDTIVIVVDREGQDVYNPRNISLRSEQLKESIDRALSNTIDTRTVTFEDIGRTRVMSVPIVEDGRTIGAVQAMRSLQEHETQLAIVRWMTILGVGIGVAIAIPAGLYLAARAMRPIDIAFQQQRTFVADASHELRTPLTLIRATADYALMDDSKRIGEISPELTSIVAEVDRTDRMIDDLLTLARVDAGSLALDRQELDLAEVAGDDVESMLPLFGAKGVHLSLEAETRTLAHTDRDRVSQVIRILLDNALRHTKQGGSVQVAVLRAGSEIEVRVRDTGSGISAQHLPHIFNRFYRSDPSRSRSTGNAGLGLSIAKAIVEAHGGRIWVTSEPGSGTTAAFTLPALATPPNRQDHS